MKKSINPQAIQIQKRFFQALEICINSGTIKGGLKGFCEEHSLNRVKYQRIKASFSKPIEEQRYIIDVDALQYICIDGKVSSEWLLFGNGGMFKQ